jgi:DNA-binding transcriptional regulator YiaG
MLLHAEPPRIRTIRHAVNTLGSETVLAELLHIKPEQVALWLSGEQVPADGTYFVVLALLQRALHACALERTAG